MATWLGALGAGHGGRLVRKGSPTMWSTAAGRGNAFCCSVLSGWNTLSYFATRIRWHRCVLGRCELPGWLERRGRRESCWATTWMQPVPVAANLFMLNRLLQDLCSMRKRRSA